MVYVVRFLSHFGKVGSCRIWKESISGRYGVVMVLLLLTCLMSTVLLLWNEDVFQHTGTHV
jgi:prepilin signal peptidase PulO-like enzyme (type II secretory pathway)